jgi:two-component sensor histidine kinase
VAALEQLLLGAEMTDPSEISRTLALLDDVRLLTLGGDDLEEILLGIVERLVVCLPNTTVTLFGFDETGVLTEWASAGDRPFETGKSDRVEFPIQADDIIYGLLRLERRGLSFSHDERRLVSIAAGFATGAFMRMDMAVRRPARGHAKDPPSNGWMEGHAISTSAEAIHRIRNILAVIRGIARRTAERTTSVEDYAAQLDGRISALARVQTALIARKGDCTDLAALIDDEMLSHSINTERLNVNGPRVSLKVKAAEVLGLTVHELAENSIKYGALSAKNGKISVNWWIDKANEPGQLRLRWIETGVPIVSVAPRVMGFGHELIHRTLPYELAAKTAIDFKPGEFRCDLAIPLSSKVIASDAHRDIN